MYWYIYQYIVTHTKRRKAVHRTYIPYIYIYNNSNEKRNDRSLALTLTQIWCAIRTDTAAAKKTAGRPNMSKKF